MTKQILCAVGIAGAVLLAPNAQAATIHYTTSGVGQSTPSDAQNWGDTNITGNSAAFEITFDYDSSSIPTNSPPGSGNAMILWEAGGVGTGSGLLINSANLYFYAGNDNTDVLQAAHGLSGNPQDIQVVALLTINTGGDDTFELFVNGSSIGSDSTIETSNDWAGGNQSGIGGVFDNARFDGTPLSSARIGFTDDDDNDITLNVYDADDANFDINDVLVPEPATLGLLVLGGGILPARRRRR